MKKILIFTALMNCVAYALAQTTPAAQCPFEPDYLSKHFGHTFKAGVPEKGLLGKACVYSSDGPKIWLDTGPNPAPSVEMYRKMSNPPGTTFTAVSNDPDKAVHINPKADAPSFASISYERKGVLVNITVTGIDGKSAIPKWNTKLVQLKRVP